jgi:2-keto-4-pentenoate hydratase/2-oxohepta-3-ene-1,7-dioic acid hydratase in catechol pathway
VEASDDASRHLQEGLSGKLWCGCGWRCRRRGQGARRAVSKPEGSPFSGCTAGAGTRHPWSAPVQLLPPIPEPDKILCVGINYVAHRDETGRSESAYPTLFTRFANTQVGHGQPLIRPLVSTEFDFEAELAVVIGKRGRHIPRENALSLVAGYSCYQDATLRDWQRHTSQFTPGKNFIATGGFGPWLLTADEVPDPSKLTVIGRLNGQEMQRSGTDLLIFDVPELIAYITAFTELVPGDVISTGTPGGVGSKRKPPVWMKAGDIFEVEVTGVGTLRNPVQDEASQ